MVSTQYSGFSELSGHHIPPHHFWFLMNILIRNHFYFILSFYFLSILCICILVSNWLILTYAVAWSHSVASSGGYWTAVITSISVLSIFCMQDPLWSIKNDFVIQSDSMGKRRIVRPEDDEEIMADIKRSKLPLESRTGFMERTEHLRQIFMCELLRVVRSDP